MIANKFIDICRKMINEIEIEELKNIDNVAGIIADAVINGGNVFIYDRGHMLNSELIIRAGGLPLIKRFHLDAVFPVRGIMEIGHCGENKIELPEKDRITMEYEQKMAEYSLVNGELKPRDVLILGSVSGKSRALIELALAANRMGIITIAMTSIKYSSQIKSSHSSSKKLYEVCDYVLDNHSEFGDASVAVEGLDEKICPTSGINAAIVAWCLTAQIVEHMVEKGIKPAAYMSVNLPGGEEKLNMVNELYMKRGY